MKLALLILIPLALGLTWEDITETEKDDMFENWAAEYNRTYSKDEYNERKLIFFENAQKILVHNNNPDTTFVMGVNQFADMTGSEFRAFVHGGENGYCYRGRKKTNQETTQEHMEILRERLGMTEKNEKINAPDEVDWTTKTPAVVTPVKNQEQCGSCWAFSATGAIESAFAIATGKLVSLSEQELVDCSRAEGNQGCQGGLMDDAFKYVAKKGGLCSETEYPYKAKNGICKENCGTRYDAIKGHQDVESRSKALEEAVARQPISVAVEADQQSFQFYKSGILTGTCGTKLDHGVLAVGYGATSSGEKFWKVKNSWGATWGESGYIRLCRDCFKNFGRGECGILMQPSYPIAK